MKLTDHFFDLFFPPRCAFCHRLLENGSQKICDDCINTLPYTVGDGQKQKFPFITECVSPFYYESHVRNSLLRYKFGGVSAYSQIYADYLIKCIDENGIFCDIITWVPLSKKRLRSRGYDQAQLIACAAAEKLGLDCIRLLIKCVDTPAQSATGNAQKRQANISGAYKTVLPDLLRERNILLIDDIVTTGSTVSECARMLCAAGANRVYAATVARKRD